MIRTMNISDYEAVRQLWLSCPGMGLNTVDDSREGIQRFLLRNPDTCFIAEEEGLIVGAIMAGNDGRRGYIYHTAVSPTRQKQGIGSQLVCSALSALQAAGITKVALVAFKKNETGNRFWESQGFTCREDLFYRNKTLVEMTRIDT